MSLQYICGAETKLLYQRSRAKYVDTLSDNIVYYYMNYYGYVRIV
jgi:hypothetical protein